jgi:replication factor C subunit 2/4
MGLCQGTVYVELTVSQLHDLVILHPNLDSRQKSRCALIFAEVDKALCDGADEELWILEVGTRVWKALAPVKY